MIVPAGHCMLCGQPSVLDIEDEELARAAKEWKQLPVMRRPLIQRALPDLTPGQREQLLSGSHEECFDRAFPPEEE